MLIGFEIVQFFEQHPDKAITILQLSKQTRKSYGATHAAAQHLIKEGVLKAETVGASTLCSINLESERAIALLTAASILRASALDPDTHMKLHDATLHLRDSAYTIWYADNALFALMRPHSTTTVAGGLQVHSIALGDAYPTMSSRGIFLWGAETYWRLAAERIR